MRSATPQLSKNVLSLTEEKRNLEKALISLRPILIIAAWFRYEQSSEKEDKIM